MSEQQHENIFQAINAIMSEVGYVKKQRAAALNYSYAGEAALIEAVRPAMVSHGVFCYVSNYDNVTQSEYTTSKGSSMTRTTLRATVRFQHESGSFIDVQSVGEGADSGDKSLNKAMTGAYKYALRQTFCIETGDDPDKYPSEPAKQPISHSVTTTKVIPTPEGTNVQLHEKTEMPLDLAEAETTSDGELYVNIPTEKLNHMINAMVKKLKEGCDAEKAEEYNRKIGAARAIIASR